jgi:hypothetical protein
MSNNKLYHYTTFEGLKGIIDSNKLWLSDYRCMNDASEFTYAKHVLQPAIRSSFDTYIKNIKIIAADKSLEEATNTIWNIFEKALSNTFNSYIGCFCLHQNLFLQNNGLLSMWRGYGSEGGYALTFNKDRFLKSFSTKKSTKKPMRLHGNVKYLSPEEKLPKIFNRYIKNFKGCIDTVILPYIYENKPSLAITKDHFKAILELTARIKHPGFHEEKEWRFCIYLPKEEIEHYFSPKIRKHGTRLVSYIELPFDLKNCLEQIIIGPQLNIETKSKFIKSYLQEVNLENVEVKISNTPYISY